jgi:flavin reductase (DIM6/NTAB) family NADH-FMN oxidoreductase RutF
MFYEPSNGHGLPHDPLKALVAPRPIAWVSTVSAAGVANLAPYSFFNILTSKPQLVWFTSESRKDSAANIEETGEFVVNIAGRNVIEQMNVTAVDAPHGVDEFALAGLTAMPSRLVKPPRVGEARAALECRMTEMFSPKGLDGNPSKSVVTIGEVVGVYIDDAMLKEGLYDTVTAGNLSRLGYMDYLTVDEVFTMRRPRWGKDLP